MTGIAIGDLEFKPDGRGSWYAYRHAPANCSRCGGTGVPRAKQPEPGRRWSMAQKDRCRQCAGRGLTDGQRQLVVITEPDIPSGAWEATITPEDSVDVRGFRERTLARLRTRLEDHFAREVSKLRDAVATELTGIATTNAKPAGRDAL